MFNLTIHTTTDAFKNPEDAEAQELARILREIADSVESGNYAGAARDVNGNRVGGWSIKEDTAETLEEIARDMVDYKAAEFEGEADDCSINGGDMVDDFGEFRRRLKEALGGEA